MLSYLLAERFHQRASLIFIASSLPPSALFLLNAMFCLSFHFLIHLYSLFSLEPQNSRGYWSVEFISNTPGLLLCLFHLPTYFLPKLTSKMQTYVNFNYCLFSLVSKEQAAKRRNYTLNNLENQSMNNRYLPHDSLQGRMDRQEQGMQILALSLKSIMFLFFFFFAGINRVQPKTQK